MLRKVKRLDLMNLETSILHIIIVQVITDHKSVADYYDKKFITPYLTER